MSAPEQNPNAVDVAQASELTGLSEKALRRRVERGTLKSMKVGGKRLIPISELESNDLLERADRSAPDSGDPVPPQGLQTPELDGEPASEPSAPPALEEPPSPASGSGPLPNGVVPQPSLSAPESTLAAVEPEPAGVAPEASAQAPGPPPAELHPQTTGPWPTASPASPPPPAAQPAPPVEVPASPPMPMPAPPVEVETQPTAFAAQPSSAQMTALGGDAPGYSPGQYVPGQAPPYEYPPERGPWYAWYQYRAVRWLVVLLLLALIGLVVWLLFFRSSGDETAVVQPGGGPVGATEQDLIALSQQVQEPIYWAGTMPGTRMELTETNNSYAYIRYLGEDSPIGDTSANFLTVGTYPQANAFQNLSRYAGNSRAKTEQIQNGGVAVVIPGSPTSVYFAYPHEDVQVEVYDPQPQRALELVKSGVVRPVIASTSATGTAPATGTATVPTTTPAAPSDLPTIPQG